MAKLIELSLLISLIAIPAMAAKEQNPTRGLRKAVVHAFWFNVVYLLMMIFVIGRLSS